MTVPSQYSLSPSIEQVGQLLARNDFLAAEHLCRQILAREPKNADAMLILGRLALRVGDSRAAVELLSQSIEINGENAQTYLVLGNAFVAVHRLADAIAAFERAIVIQPLFADAVTNLGIAMAFTGRFADSVAVLRRAVSLKPDVARARDGLGTSLRLAGYAEESVAEHRKAVELEPSFAAAYFNLGLDFVDLGRHEDGINAFRRALAISPNYKDAHTSIVCQMQFSGRGDPRAIYEEHRKWNRTFAEPLKPSQPVHSNDRDPERRLRVGYVSADFRHHSVSYFLEDLLAGHDSETFEIFCYADVVGPDEVTLRLRHSVDEWREITGQSDEAVAGVIIADRIDILIDLAGHTGGNRLLVFARKPAPIQISYLGYIGSTGLDAIDYRITDGFLDPPGTTEQFHSEQLLRLPNTFACYHPPTNAPEVSELPAMSNGYITFASFTTVQKLNAALLHSWATILSRLSDSRMLIVARGLRYSSLARSIQTTFKQRGIHADRITLLDQLSFPDYLSAHGRADIVLDTFPVNGHTVNCHALWMGLPVVSLAGISYSQRLGASVLSNLGYQNLIASAPQHYVDIAVQLGRDLPRLEEFRRSIRWKMRASPLMDSGGFARSFERALRTVWREWCARWGPGILQ